MLLRRITKHVKDQNWFAVGIDFAIVVIGVFIGIQVANWNDSRSQRALESAYVERLHQEVEDIEAVRAGIVSARTNARRALSSAFNKLINPDGAPLNGLECFLIAFNPPVTSPTDDLPLIVELLSSGRLTIFSDKKLEKALGEFLIARNRAYDAGEGIRREIIDLDHEYAGYYSLRGLISEVPQTILENIDEPEGFEEFVSCDEALMRADRAFLNDLAGLERMLYFHDQNNLRVSEALKDLHLVLDHLLGFEHGNEGIE